MNALYRLTAQQKGGEKDPHKEKNSCTKYPNQTLKRHLIRENQKTKNFMKF